MPEENARFPGIEVTDCCELPHECWEPNPGPLRKKQIFSFSPLSLKIDFSPTQ